MERQLSPLEILLRGMPVVEGAQLAHQFMTHGLRGAAPPQQLDLSRIPMAAGGFTRPPDDVRPQPRNTAERIAAFLATLQSPGTAY
jgi:hypothetical protein